jgi:hypothetical protein
MWIDEHRSSYEKLRDTNPLDAKSELGYLKDSTEQAALHVQRLSELLVSGYKVDDEKCLPKDFLASPWLCWVDTLLQQRFKPH